MNRTSFGVATFVLLATVGATAGGCATEVVEEQAESSSAIGVQMCGEYERSSACSAPLFLQKAWELGSKNVWSDAVLPAAAILGCFSALRGAGIIVNGTRTLAPRLLSGGAAKVIKWLAEFEACHQTTLYLDRIGLGANISCFLEPLEYDAKVHQCYCQNECTAAHGSTSIGYLDNQGMRSCHCTTDAHEAACGIPFVIGCAEWSSNDANDPNYCACKRPKP
jgi:hypothetical protein